MSVTRVLNKSKRRQRAEDLAGDFGYASVREMLHDWYVHRHISIGNIAKMLWMSFQNTRELLLEHEVPIRDLGERLHNGRVAVTQALIDEVCRDGVECVSQRLNVDQGTLRFHLKKWIASRSVGIKEKERPVKLVQTKPTTTRTAPARSTTTTTTTTWPTSARPVQDTPKAVVVEPEPEVYVNGRRVTEYDVREMLRTLGDEELQRYERGEIPKAEAFAQARNWLKQVLRRS